MSKTIQEYAKQVLMIGPEYSNPKGGIAMVLYNLNRYVLGGKMQAIANSGAGGKLRKLWLFIAGLVKLFFTLLCRRNIKLVHIHTASRNSFERTKPYITISKWFNVKVALHLHGGLFIDYAHRHPSAIDYINKCDALIVLADTWKDQLAEQLNYPKPIFVLNNIIDRPEPCEKTKSDDMVHFLYLGRLDVAKGAIDLIQAIADVADTVRGKAIFHIAGTGDAEPEMKQLIEKSQIDDLIKFEGWVSGESKRQLLERCDVMLSPSHFEALGLNNVEAMSHGMPVIAYRVGGIPSIVHDQVNGILVERNDVEGLANAIADLTNDPDKIRTLAQATHAVAEQYYQPYVTNQLRTIYQSLL